MSDNDHSSEVETGSGSVQQRRRDPEKRPRTAYVLYRRYRLMSRLAGVLGGAIGVALVAYSLVPTMLAGEPVPPSSFLVGGMLVGVMALVPYGFVQWRWRRLKAELEDY